MAMKAHDSAIDDSLRHEIDIWREANIGAVPATSALGLALSAHRRGFRARVISSVPGLAFESHIREIMAEFYKGPLEALFEDLVERAKASHIPVEVRPVTEGDIVHALGAGEIPILLSDTRVLGDPWDPIPHWVIVSGIDEKHAYLHNPLSEHEGAVALEPYDLETFRKAIGFLGEAQLVIVGPPYAARALR